MKWKRSVVDSSRPPLYARPGSASSGHSPPGHSPPGCAAWSAPLLDGLNVAALALMAGVTIQLGQVALVDVVTVALGAVSLLILLRWRPSSIWLILGGALVGLAAHLVGLA